MAKALNSDVPPRDAAERVTFATWAIVTGKSPGGIFNTLPKLDGDTAAKMAERLSERAEGPITAEDGAQWARLVLAIEESYGTEEYLGADDLLADLRDPDVECQLGERRGEAVEQPDVVVGVHLDHGVGLRLLRVDVDAEL